MNPEIDWLKRWNQYSPNATALVDGDTLAELSYRELYLQAKKLAQRLSQFGVVRGDRVALLSRNRLECFSLFFACARLGAILVPLNTRLARPELEHILQDSQACVLVHDEPEMCPNVAGVFRIEFDCLLSESSDVSAFEEFHAQMEDPAFILYTSGTTGLPKGALISHRMILWNSLTTGLRLNLTQSDCAVIFLPLFHTGGWNVLSLPLLHRGASLVLLTKFESVKVLKLSQDFRCTLLFGVPTTMQMMSQTPEFNQVALKSLRYAIVGGEPLPLAQIDLWGRKGIPIRQGYGLTEFGPNVFSLNEQDCILQRGSIGFPNFDVQVRVVNDQGRDCGAEEVGELWLAGPQAFSGYWNNASATEQSRQGEWVKTGDLVRFNSEGFFFVVGRKKEMFISGGENVYPAEIEKVLQTHPLVLECAVVGQKDPQWGESGVAFIVQRDQDLQSQNRRESTIGTENLEAELKTFLIPRLAKFKIPKKWVFLPSLPKTESGKIKKTQLSSGLDACEPKAGAEGNRAPISVFDAP